MMKKLMAVAIAFGLAAVSANAATGTFGSFVQIDGTWYDGSNPGALQLTDFDGLDLGTFNIGDSSLITGASLLTFKNGGGDVTGAQIQWRVYEVGDTPGSFNIQGIGFGNESPAVDPAGNSYANGGDQNWQQTGFTINYLNGLTAGDYEFEVFFRGTSNEGDIFSNNGGNNFTATFTVVPEPGTLALFGIGMASLAIARRRRA